MTFARQRLVDDLRRLGLKPGEIVMVHASLRAIGPVYGGPDEVHLAVAEAAAPDGTVVAYVGTPAGADDVGRGFYSAEGEAELVQFQPPFDSRTARASRDFGALAEFFRSYKGTVCSNTACARTAARGPRAPWLLADQGWSWGFGKGSPFEKLCAAGGSVLLLGSSHDEVTLLHYAEAIADFPDKRIVRFQVPVLQDGKRSWIACEEFETSERNIHANWPEDFFGRIVNDFIVRFSRTDACSVGEVGNAYSVRMDAAALVAHAVPLMQRRSAGEDVP